MRQETNQVFLRALDASDGVRPALRSHARRGLDGSSLLGKFGYDLAENCVILNAIRVDGSPGRTFAFEGIKLADAFAHDPRAEREGIDPLHAYKAALPWAAGEIEALKNTHFIVGRGCLIVFSTTREHVLDGIEYAYVVWFKNYLNIGSELAWLVPKEIIMDKIRGTGINWLDYVGPNPDLPDINQRDLNPDGLKDEARRRGLTILELDLSSFAGGLCNMYPTNASPHFERERGLKETRDLKGHVHKSHLLGGYKRLAPPELLNLLRYYELLHGAVGEVITSLQDRFDLFRIVLSLWNRNFTGSLASKDSGEEREGRVSLRQNGFRPQTRARMLELAYLEHGQRKVNP